MSHKIAEMLRAAGRKVTEIDATKDPRVVADEILRVKQQKRCRCVAYESADGDEYGPCHCGHSPEDHTRNGCEGAEAT